MKRERLRMKNIICYENSIKVVHNGDINVFEGEIIGLIGRNDSGINSFIGSISGEHPCKNGEIWISEKSRHITSIEQARKEGVFLIKNRSSLVDEFSIKETMQLNYAFTGNKIRYKIYLKKCKVALEELGLYRDYETKIQELTFHQRILIEMVQAIVSEGKIIIFNNVLRFLSATALGHIKKIFKKLTDEGISIILVENQPTELIALVSRLFIMRKGRSAACLDQKELKEHLILSIMEGGDFQEKKWKTIEGEGNSDSEILQFQNVTTQNRELLQVTFSLHKNEILGIWNPNHRFGREMIHLLSEKNIRFEGVVLLEDRVVKQYESDAFMKKGIVAISEIDELFSNMTFGENIEMAVLRKRAIGGIIKKEREMKYLIQDIMGEYISNGDKVYRPQQSIPENVLIQKKVVLCRNLLINPKAIIYGNPFLKMDTREMEIFCQDILKIKSENISQIVISSQLDMLTPMCDRILQADQGKIVRILKEK